MGREIYIPYEKLLILKEDLVTKDKFTIGAEPDAAVGGGYAHIQEDGVITESYGYNGINWEDVDEIEVDVDDEFSDDEELQEYMEAENVPYDIAKLNNTYFTISFYDRNHDYIGEVSDTYENIFADKYTEFEDDELRELTLNTWRTKPNQKEFAIREILYNKWCDSDDIYGAAKHLFYTTDEYFHGAHGYVLADGTIIVMPPGSDHNSIEQIHKVESKWDFVEMGNPSMYENSLRVGGLLTWEQKEIIGQLIRSYSDDELFVSFLGGPKGEQSCKYTYPDYRRVFADIDRYYNEGIIPLGESKESDKDIINEGLSPILYHYTNIYSLLDMVESNEIQLRGSLSNGYNFLSTTRQLNSTIGYPSPNNNASMQKSEHSYCLVRLTLDGRAIQNNYKGIQYNHWGRFSFSKDEPSQKSTAKINTPLNTIESEDRIISDKESIPFDESVLRAEILVRPTEIDEIYNPYEQLFNAFQELIENGAYAEVYFDEDKFNKINRRGTRLDAAIYELEEYMYERMPEEDDFDEEDLEEQTNNATSLLENYEIEVEDNEINLSSFRKKDTLPPKIWKEGDILNSKVRFKLLDIADDFWDFVNITWVEPKGIILTGSICNFNWSKYSDIDLHILVDFKEINERTDFVQDYFDSKKNEWNNEHEKLKIYGFPVELYVQDINNNEVSGGKYDLENNNWITHPSQDSITDINGAKYEIKHIAAKIMTKIDDLEEKLKKNPDDAYNVGKEANKLLKKVKKMRKYGLERSGEGDTYNIVYKCLKRTEYLEKLWKISSESYDKINSIYEAVKHLKEMLSEEVVADGNAEHNVYSKRWKQEREDLKNFILHNGKMMTSKENGKRYFVYYDQSLSELVGNNYCVCLQYDPFTLKPSGTVYIRALDKFTSVLFKPQFDTRGFDNTSGTADDVQGNF